MYKFLLTLTSIFFLNRSAAQLTIFGTEKITWKYYDLDSLLSEGKKFANEDLVILDEYVQFNLHPQAKSRVRKNVLISINSERGLQKISTVLLPEAFDFYDEGFHEQANKARIKTPYVETFEVITFAARHVRDENRGAVTFNKNNERFRRLYKSGDSFEDQTWRFQLTNLRVGDVIELYYDCSFESSYSDNLFYYHSVIPKLHSEYTVVYAIEEIFKNAEFSKAQNIPDSLVTFTTKGQPGGGITHTLRARLHHLQGINYHKNCFAAENLPHLYVNFKVWPKMTDKSTLSVYKPRHFQWMFFSDTVNDFKKAYTSHYAGVRKFTNLLPPSGNDSNNVVFLRALCDSFNNCRYISSRDLYLKESHIYDLYRGEHLLKKRIVQNETFNIIKDVMNERSIFYYMVFALDGRFAQQNTAYNIHSKYESNLFAVPVNNSVVFLMPRYSGVKYFLNELPYYFEGHTVGLMGRNFQEGQNNKILESLRFVKTQSGNQNTNTRSETAMITINRDSLKVLINEKLSLSGQFSTLLRHLYQRDCIDSTVPAYYYKKCSDKPGSSQIQVKNTASSKVYPFKQTFSIASRLALQNSNQVNMKQWFSFPLDPKLASDAPTHDYYFDFVFTDSYHLSIDFTESTRLLNSAEFNKKITNDYFTLESEIIDNSDRNYLMRVRLTIKQKLVPASEGHALVELAQTLHTLNHFTLQLAP